MFVKNMQRITCQFALAGSGSEHILKDDFVLQNYDFVLKIVLSIFQGNKLLA